MGSLENTRRMLPSISDKEFIDTKEYNETTVKKSDELVSDENISVESENIPVVEIEEYKKNIPISENKSNEKNSNISVNQNNLVSEDKPVLYNSTINIKQGEEKMADVDTTMLAGQHADIRREGADHTAEIRYDIATRAGDIRREVATGIDKTGDLIAATASDIRLEQQGQAAEIVKEGLKGGFETRGDIKDTRYDLASRVENAADRITGLDTQYYIAGQTNANEAARDLASLKVLTDANAARMSVELALNVEKVGAASALQAEKIASAVALGQANLSRDVFMDGQKTRDLINDHKYHDLNRALVERNTELVEERAYGRNWRDHASQNQYAAQFAQLQSQMQNFNSQLADTRQGMVNFGTMAGVGLSSTSNNVK